MSIASLLVVLAEVFTSVAARSREPVRRGPLRGQGRHEVDARWAYVASPDSVREAFTLDAYNQARAGRPHVGLGQRPPRASSAGAVGNLTAICLSAVVPFRTAIWAQALSIGPIH
jgi:hypothetical protein